ncbi:MAG TPA: polysaccharide biosynthesis/export family protein [Stellaceae bacterium]|jgi:protein involved in polysaccharide export with SLBB domain
MRKLLLSTAVWLLILPVILPAAAAPATPSDGGGYRLGVGDELRIRVFEWRSATGDVHQWDALKGEYDVGADGSIAMPLLGALKASGLSTTQLGDEISDQLQSRLKLSIRPQASVDIVQYRPFYISGDVNKPGQYPYQPSLTVLQAISIAGGRYRVNDPGLVLTATGDLQVNRLDYTRLLARGARLRAEIADAAAMTLPPELRRLQNDPAVAQMIQREAALFAAHRDALAAETDALNQLKSMLNGEVASLQSKMKNMDQQLTLMNQELSSTSTLVQRGLAVAPRVYELRQTELETEGRRLDLDTAMLRAKEDVAKADQSLIQLRDKTRNQMQDDLAEVEQKLRDTSARMANEMTIAGSETARAENGGGAGGEEAPPTCVILRKSDGRSERIQGDEDTVLAPGDTIRILRPTVPVAATAAVDPPTTLAADPPALEAPAHEAPASPTTPPARHTRGELPRTK